MGEIPIAPGLREFNNASTADVKFVFRDGTPMFAHMKTLKACSTYFGSHADFTEGQSFQLEQNKNQDEELMCLNEPSYKYTIHVKHLTADEEAFQRLLLYIYTHDRITLQVTHGNFIHLVALNHFLGLHKSLDLQSIALAALVTAPFNVTLSSLQSAVETGSMVQDEMLGLFRELIRSRECRGGQFGTCKCLYKPLTSKTKARTQFPNANYKQRQCLKCLQCEEHCALDSIRIALSLPAMWVLSTRKHELTYDVIVLRKEIQNAVKRMRAPAILARFMESLDEVQVQGLQCVIDFKEVCCALFATNVG
ncbi:uncharacterized protein EV422DRAFT_505341 [Fimicolochytrium jonesii]|uniref:uncharacterized protein n=1 Tax=Fimicolochytrium jonesii TaxID=1396493 RepID=UPI0022FE17B6|nr:uncharacterized protein EV422DRAFT_505341 [Fimicolochytrium jonesii]KAI8822518.1 hypothetical protein EV422DRAFT_505341 [Fimicolochytrium jonesii]